MRGPGRLGQAGVVALWSLGGQRGAALAPIRWGRDASCVSNQRAVGQEGPRLRGDGWELPTTSSWGAGVRDGGDGAFTQGARALYSRRDMAGETGLGTLPAKVPNHLQKALEKVWAGVPSAPSHIHAGMTGERDTNTIQIGACQLVIQVGFGFLGVLLNYRSRPRRSGGD